jgi:hypothetical protein
MTLESVLTRVRAARSPQTPPVVVFDLDGTLFDNGPRTWRILQEVLQQRGDEAALAKLQALAPTRLPYLLRDTLERAGIYSDELLHEARAHWEKRFFTDDVQLLDQPLAGAHHLVDELWAAGATIVYLSGRDVPNMLVGVAQSLRQHKFPVGCVRTSIILKPAFHIEDVAFKRDALPFIDTMGEVVAAFDNEPANCNLFAHHWPRASSFFLRTSHAPNPPPLAPSVFHIDDFVVA